MPKKKTAKKSTNTEQRATSSTRKNAIILAVLILLVAIIATMYNSTPQEQQVEEIPIVQEETTVVEEVEEVVQAVEEVQVTDLFAIVNDATLVDTQITVVVNLKHGSYIVQEALGKEYGIYTEMITDGQVDIPVIGLTFAQRELFPNRATTDELYTVSGTLRSLDEGLRVDVASIE